MNLMDLFSIASSRAPTKIALEFFDPENPTSAASLTYAELLIAADRMAVALRKLGVEKGDRIAFYLSNRPEFVVAYLAALRLGATMVPINLRYRNLEISHILADCAPRLVLTESDYLPVLEEAGFSASGVLPIVSVDALDSRSATRLDPVPSVDAEDLAMILYTSGTTGRSKGAMISHNNVLATVTGLISAWGWQEDDQLLLCLPLFHTHGLVVGLHCALAAGATLRLRPKFYAGHTLAELTSSEVTLFFAVPTIYTRLVDELRHASQSGSQTDLSHIRLFCSGSAPLDPETFAAFAELAGHDILERYGMTETGMNLSNLYAGPRVPGTVGVPLPGVSMRIVDASGADVAPGAEGELLVRGSNVFSGYWRDPEKSAAGFSQDGLGRSWFHTGDLARQDVTTGYVSLLGRKHELIISGGFNIYPREIEELLLTCPGVLEAAVVGRPDPEWGECPVAYVVCQFHVSDDTLRTLCRRQLASFKTPRQFIRVEQLPRNAMGKLQKHLLP